MLKKSGWRTPGAIDLHLRVESEIEEINNNNTIVAQRRKRISSRFWLVTGFLQVISGKRWYQYSSVNKSP